MELLAELSRDQTRAILAVTHDNRTLRYADRIIHIEDGRIVADEHPKSGRRQGAGKSKERA
jgi:putative ABC transport system ATP-binding protein